MLEGCIAEIHNITSLDISDNGEPGIGNGERQRVVGSKLGKGHSPPAQDGQPPHENVISCLVC